MYDITLICTVHQEEGACNSRELYKIMETIDPEIVFEEIPPSAFNAFYQDKTRTNLETKTISKYLESHQIDHAPVDYDDIPPFLFEDNRRLHSQVEAISFEYRKLLDWHSSYVKQYGFEYLNSIYCSDLYDQLYEAIEKALQQIDDDKLIQTFSLWNGIIEKRECEMINNIYKYSKEHGYNKGLLFLGAAHRESMINKIQKYSATEYPKLNWNYDRFKIMNGNA